MKTGVVLLVVTNLLTALIAIFFYFASHMAVLETDEENHHLYLMNEKYKNYILEQNSGLTVKQFMSKHSITKERQNFVTSDDLVEYKLMYFQFKNGVLSGLE